MVRNGGETTLESSDLKMCTHRHLLSTENEVGNPRPPHSQDPGEQSKSKQQKTRQYIAKDRWRFKQSVKACCDHPPVNNRRPRLELTQHGHRAATQAAARLLRQPPLFYFPLLSILGQVSFLQRNFRIQSSNPGVGLQWPMAVNNSVSIDVAVLPKITE